MAILNHIGIAVVNLPKMKELFSILGLTIEHHDLVKDQGVMTHFLPLPLSHGHIEFLEVTDPSGPVAEFLKKRGPGFHHLAFEVKLGELEPICEQLKGAGYKLIYNEPQTGARGMKINFIHPSSCGGILIEVMEPA